MPETLVVDHGKVYVSEHLTSVCRRMGMPIRPARLRTGRDKGPDIRSRGEDPEGEAFFFLDELEEIIREWTASRFTDRRISCTSSELRRFIDYMFVTMGWGRLAATT